MNLQFSRLRVQWHEGIVAENVHFGSPGATNRPQVVAREVELQVDLFSLLRGRPQIEALSVRHGRMAWPVLDTNQPNRYITAEEIQTDLRFLTNDVWVLDNFHL